MKARNRRVGIAVATTVTAVAVFSAAGGVGLAGGVASLHQYGPGAGQYQYGHKVTICHKGKRTIRVSARALPAHIRHGDLEGVCANVVKQGDAGKLRGKKAEHAREADTQDEQHGSNGKGHDKGHDK